MSQELPISAPEINPEWEEVALEYQTKRNSIKGEKLIQFMLSLGNFEREMVAKYPGVDMRKVRLFHTLIGSTPIYEMGFDMLDLPGDEIKQKIDDQHI